MRNEARHTHRFSYADYLGFEGDTRWELIDGEAHAMASAPDDSTPAHRAEPRRALIPLFSRPAMPPVHRPTDVKLSDFDVVQPDGLVVCDRAKIGEAAIVGTPDLVIEVLSPATEARDRREKRAVRTFRYPGVLDRFSKWLLAQARPDRGAGRQATLPRRFALGDRRIETGFDDTTATKV